MVKLNRNGEMVRIKNTKCRGRYLRRAVKSYPEEICVSIFIYDFLTESICSEREKSVECQHDKI